MQLVINKDTTFLVTDELGNVPTGAEYGLYHEDTRFLCRYALTLDGQPPLPLSARATDHSAAVHFLTNPALAAVPRGLFTIVRRRLIGTGMREDLEITNHWDQDAAFSLELRFEADFAHIIAVRQTIKVAEGPTPDGVSTPEVAEGGRSLRFRHDRDGTFRQLVVNICEQPEVVDGRCRFGLRLAPRERWHLCIELLTLDDEDRYNSADASRGRGGRTAWVDEHKKRRRAELVQRAPRLETDSYVLQRAYERSVADFAALRIKGEDVSGGEFVIAAGIPWFMALFGRDALIAAYQGLPFYPEAAKGVLRSLARLQGKQVDPVRGEEPGKILHEHRPGVRSGAQELIPAFPYYGTVDATPLFLGLSRPSTG